MISDHFILPGNKGFKGNLLDQYLAHGYYRMQHIIFTTHNTQVDHDTDPVPVFWLRTRLKDLAETKTAITIRKKCAAFDVYYKSAQITDELEILYSIYRKHVKFSTALTCEAYLHQYELENPYDSRMVEIRHNKDLIGAGFFDMGDTSMSGIINFYHPLYHKFSLGKYLILKKIDYAIANGLTWYYTGYISTANSKFDYKLFPDESAIEVYLPVENEWKPYSMLGKRLLQDYFLKNIQVDQGEGYER